jgi:hypothetical protein
MIKRIFHINYAIFYTNTAFEIFNCRKKWLVYL